MTLSADTLTTLAAAAVIIGFLWTLHRDVAGLRERMSRLEGAFEGLRDAVNRLDSRMIGVENRLGAGSRSPKQVGLAQRNPT